MYEYHAKKHHFQLIDIMIILLMVKTSDNPSFSFPQLNWVTTPQKRFSCWWLRRIFSLSSIASAVAFAASFLLPFSLSLWARMSFTSSPGCSLVSGAPVFSFPCPSGILNVWLRRLKSKSTGIACYVDSLEPCLIFHPEGSSLPTCRTRMFSALLEGYGNGLKNDESHTDGTKMEGLIKQNRDLQTAKGFIGMICLMM